MAEALEQLDARISRFDSGLCTAVREELLWIKLAQALQSRHAITGSPQDNERAVTLLKSATIAGAENHKWFAMLSHALRCHAKRTRDTSEIDEAIVAQLQAQQLLDDEADDSTHWKRLKAEYTALLAAAYYTKFEITGYLDDMQLMVQHTETSVELYGNIPGESIQHLQQLWTLGRALLALYDATANDEHLRRAIRTLDCAAQLVSPEADARPDFMFDLGAAWGRQFETSYEIAHLDRAITAHRKALSSLPETDPRHAKYCAALGLRLQQRHWELTNLHDLDESIRLLHRSGERTGFYARVLALALFSRFAATGNDGDMHLAEELLRNVPPQSTSDWYTVPLLWSLGVAQLHCGRFKECATDLMKAADSFRGVLKLLSPVHPQVPPHQVKYYLAVALEELWYSNLDYAHLSEAYSLAQQVVKTAPRNDPEEVAYLRTLSRVRDAIESKVAFDAVFCSTTIDLTSRLELLNEKPKVGGTAFVHLANFTRTGDVLKVAVKIIKEDTRAMKKAAMRLGRELHVWQRLDHKHILPFLGVFKRNDDFPGLVSPWCDNGDICSFLECRQKDPELNHLRLTLLGQVLEGLQYRKCANPFFLTDKPLPVHEFDPTVLHCDLKGANVLISDDGLAMLSDFGFSSMDLQPDDGPVRWASSMVHGTSRWMSPELFDEDPRHTTHSDIWAFGCVVVQVYAAAPPYHEMRSDQQVIVAIAMGKLPTRPEGMQSDLWDLVSSCWSRSPKERPSASALLPRLRRMIA